MAQPQPGTIGWLDLTVENASAVREFYEAVAGWHASPVSMGTYDDYSMAPQSGADPVAGICHAQSSNAGLPPVWLPYIIVRDLDASVAACRARGGSIVGDLRSFGDAGRWCVLKDPAGAYAALFQPAAPAATGDKTGA